MAKLTEQVGTVNSGKPIIDPGREGPSVLGGVADLISGAIPGATKFVEERRAEGRANTMDEFAGRVHEIRTGATQATATEGALPAWTNTTFDPTTGEVPTEVRTSVADMVRMQRGVEQGRVSRAAYDLQLESLVTEFGQKHPELRAEIAAYVTSQGLDHYMYRGQKADQAVYENEEAAQLAAEKYQFDYAARLGIVTIDTPISVGAARGREAIASAAEAERLKEEAALARQNTTATREEAAAANKERGAQMQANLVGQAARVFAPIIDMTTTALRAAGTDAERQSVLAESRTNTLGLLAQYEIHGIAEIQAVEGGPEEIKAFQAFVQSQRESIGAIYTASFESNVVVLRNMEAAFGITAARAAPMYSRTVALIGQSAANALFGDQNGLAQLAPEIQEAVRNEIANYDPTTERGTVSLARMISYMRGETGFADLSGEEADKYLRANNRGLIAAQQAIVGGDMSELSNWMPLYGNTTEAAVELMPTDANLIQFHTATGLIANPGARAALAQARKEDPEYGAALTQASRAGSAHILGSVLGRRPSTDNTVYSVRINPSTGLYEATVDPAKYNNARREYESRVPEQTWNDQLGTFVDSPRQAFPSIDTMRSRMPGELRTWTDIVNTSVTHLVETDAFDPEIDNSKTPRQRRDAYMRGSGPARIEAAGGTTADSSFSTIVSNLNTAIETASTEMLQTSLEPDPLPPRDQLQSTVKTRGEAMGLDWGLVERVVRRESSWDAGAENTSTRARGLFQINDDNNSRTLDENINDGLNMLKDAQETAQRTLGRAPQDWEVYVVHQQGMGGGPALLNPANADKNAVDVLTPLYGDRAMARSAVTGNGGRVDMTAAEFTQAIRQFYER